MQRLLGAPIDQLESAFATLDASAPWRIKRKRIADSSRSRWIAVRPT